MYFYGVILASLDFFVQQMEWFQSVLAKNELILIHRNELALKKDNDLPEFIKKVKELGFLVKLDTNGSYPERLASLIESGDVDYVAMDIKNSKEKYTTTADCNEELLQRVEKSVEILKTGKVDYEFRTTVVKEYHDVDDIKKIAEWIAPAEKYFLQNFIDSGDLIKNNLSAHPCETLELMRDKAQDIISKVEIRGI